jgi:circadian clock protein KaiB
MNIQSEVKDGTPWRFRLYVRGQSALAGTALANVRQLCRERLGSRYQLELIDIEKHIELARRDNVLAVPMLVRVSPEPVRKIVGDLTRAETVSRALNLPEAPPGVGDGTRQKVN